jgi:hypothetical protein
MYAFDDKCVDFSFKIVGSSITQKIDKIITEFILMTDNRFLKIITAFTVQRIQTVAQLIIEYFIN